MVNSWKITNGKSGSSKSSEAQVTALTGGSATYINQIQKLTGAVIAETRALSSSSGRHRHSGGLSVVQQGGESGDSSEAPKPRFNIESFISRVYN